MAEKAALHIGEVSFNDLLKNLDFSQETIHYAVMQQPKFYMSASHHYVKKMRARKLADNQLEVAENETYLSLKRFLRDKSTSMTETEIKHRIASAPKVMKVRAQLVELRAEEAYAESLVEAYKQRGYMLRTFSQLLGVELSTRDNLKVPRREV